MKLFYKDIDIQKRLIYTKVHRVQNGLGLTIMRRYLDEKLEARNIYQVIH